MSYERRNIAEILTKEEQEFLRPSQPSETQEAGNMPASPPMPPPGHTPLSIRKCKPRPLQSNGPRAVTAGFVPPAGVHARQSVTVRLDPRIVRAVRKAASERALDYVEPYTQQAIAEAALLHWLASQRYAVGD